MTCFPAATDCASPHTAASILPPTNARTTGARVVLEVNSPVCITNTSTHTSKHTHRRRPNRNIYMQPQDRQNSAKQKCRATALLSPTHRLTCREGIRNSPYLHFLKHRQNALKIFPCNILVNSLHSSQKAASLISHGSDVPK